MDSRLLIALFLLLALPWSLVVWALRRPRPPAVQVTLALALLAYQWMFYAYGRQVLWQVEQLVLLPLYGVPVPLALLLGSLTQARQARCPGAYLAWIGLAVTGLAGLLQLPLTWLPDGLLDTAGPLLTLLATALLTLTMNLLAWFLVLRLLHWRHDLRPALGHPWWLPPLVAAVMLLGWSALDAALVLAAVNATNKSSFSWATPWLYVLSNMLLSVSLRWVAGVVVLRTFRRGVVLPL
jgi:hypothetical protein